MDLLILILFIGLVAIISVLLDRWWQRQALDHQSKQPVGRPTPELAHGGKNNTLLTQIKTNWQQRMGWHTQPAAEPPKLRTWLLTHLADQPAVQQWVAALTDAELNALYQQLQTVCAAWQIDPTWLGEQPLARDPELQAAVQAAVLHYVQAQHGAVTVQAELQAFKIYLALEQRPYSYEHQPLIQELYTHLVKVGLAAPARPEALLATEKIRIDHMMRAIHAAAEANRPAFYQVVNSLGGAPQSAATTSSLPAAAAPNTQPMPAA